MHNRPYNPPQTPLDIVFEDEELLAVNKPSGLLSVPGKGAHLHDSLQTRLLDYNPSSLLVHRLDCDTSGLIIFAKTKTAQRHLGLQFERRQTRKSYIAWVHGIPTETKGEVDLPIIVDWPNRPLQKICHETGRAAQTQWRKIRRKGDFAMLEMKPKTGRSHQLRIHCREIGHPIVGDTLYGIVEQQTVRLMLHSQKLGLRHPIGGEPLDLIAKIPDDFGV